MSNGDADSRPDCFALEREITNLYVIIEKAQGELIGIHRPGRKRARLDHLTQSRQAEFKQKIQQFKSDWTSTLAQIFKLLSDQTMLSRIADDIIKALYLTRVRYKVDDEYYQAVFGFIITPIIASIMDEQELSKASKERQLRRKCFLHELIRASNTMNLSPPVPLDRQGEEIDVEAVDICSAQSQHSLRSMTQDNSSIDQCCSWEELAIVGYLINALSIHSKGVTKEGVEFSARIYHIINITYVVSITKDYLHDLKFKIDFELDRSRVTLAMEKFEESITKGLELFCSDHPLAVFRNDMRFLLTQIRMLRSTLSK